MNRTKATWRKEAKRLLAERGISARALAEQIGQQERTVRRWLNEDRSPHNETRHIEAIAAALNVPVAWLHDPIPGAQPPTGSIPPAALAAVPPEARRLLYALFDDAARAYLIRMLDEYDRLRPRAQERQQGPARRGRGRSTDG